MTAGLRFPPWLPLAALCAIPLACRSQSVAPMLSVDSEGTTYRTEIPGADEVEIAPAPAAVSSGTAHASRPAAATAGIERAADPAAATPDPDLDLDSESYERIAERLARADAEPVEHPFTGPWMPMSGSALAPFFQQPGAQGSELAPPAAPDGQGSGHWSGLPFMSDLARENGIKLPEPFGLSLTYFVINRPSRVTKVRAGVDNGGLHELPSLGFDALAKVQTVVGRFDAWILPMLDLYLLGGYVWNDSSVDMILDLPGAPGTAFKADGHLEGPVYGGGVTLAGGYANYFLVVDYNYNTVALGGLDEMNASLLTARVGFSQPNPTWCESARYYLATTYWDTARTISGSLPVSGGPISSIQYAVDQEPVDAITIGGGTNIMFSKNWGLVCEVQGFKDTIYVVGSVQFRF